MLQEEHSQGYSQNFIQILTLGITFLILPNHFLKHTYLILYSQFYFIIILFFYLLFIISFKTSKHVHNPIKEEKEGERN